MAGRPASGGLAGFGPLEASHIVFVALLRPGAKLRVPPGSREILQPKDILLVGGDPDEIARMRERGRAASEDASV